MNNDFTPDRAENEQDQTEAPVRRPLRRARRTVAPFASELPTDNAEEAVSEGATCEPSESDHAPSVDRVPEESPEQTSEKAENTDESPTPETEEAIEEAHEQIAEEAVPAEDAEAAREEASSEAAENDAEAPAGEENAETAGEENAETADEENAETADEENAEEETKEEKLSSIAETFDWIKSFLFSLTVVIFIFTLIFRGVTVNGGSMLPTLENGEYLIISDLFYSPKNGDIVVVQSPRYKNATEPLIKRVIATSGQTVKINFNTWEIRVDGELLHEDYILRDNVTSMNCEDMKPDENGEVEFKVEEGCIFVMGDHRNDSLDSRSNSVGQIDERYIMGRVMFRLSPIERLGKVD